MGNTESVSNTNSNTINDIKSEKQSNIKSIIKKPSRKVAEQKIYNSPKSGYKQNCFNINNLDDMYATPIYQEHSKSDISDGLTNYQYFKPEIPVENVDGMFRIDSQRDNKYSENINKLYKSSLKDREKSIRYRESLRNPSPYTHLSNVREQRVEFTNVQDKIRDINTSDTNHIPNENTQNNTITMLREDALIIRDTGYLTNLEKRIMIINNILIYDIDPLDIKDKECLLLPELKNKYISLRNIYHPDKNGSGNTSIFIRVNNAIEKHNFIIKSCVMDKDFIQLRSEYNNYNDNEKKKKPIFFKDIKSVTNEKFNKFYDEHKFEDEFDGGYGNLMEPSGERDDIEIEKIVCNESEFNSIFDKNVKKDSTDIVKYSIPEAPNDYAYNNLCEKKTDYSGKSSDLAYKDYKKAFELEQIGNSKLKKQISFKKYKKARENDKLILTEDQNKAIEEYKIKKEREEYNHENKLREYSDKISRYHSNVNMHFLE